MGRRRDAKLATIVAQATSTALEKAGLAGSPQSMSGAQVAPVQMMPQAKMPVLAQALARDSSQFGSQMGPNYPLLPQPLDALGENGRPDPRKYEYDISWNLQISRELAKWNVLKAVSEQCDVVARAITIRAAEVAKMDKSWIVSDEAIARIMDETGKGTAEASAIARKQNSSLIAYLNDFWDNPYPQSDRGWREWIVECIWQIMVYDGLAIHPQLNLGGKTIGLNIIDTSTIKLLLNNYGDTPRPPDPAFQQILFGFPRGEFTSTPDKDPNNPTMKFVDGSYATSMRDQLSYYVMNRRTWTPYGFSPVEQVVPLANLYMEYQKMMLFEFKHGTSADVYIKTTGDDITLSTFTNWERVWNDFSEGDTANRKKTRLLPPGFDPLFAPTIEERFKPEYIEMVLKRIAAIFGISSQQLGVIPRAGMGGGKGAQEGDQDNAETVSAKPLMNFIEEFVNSLSRRYLGATKDVVFVLQDDKGGQDDVEIANAAKIKTQSAVMTINEQRRELGLADYDFAGADEPFVVAGNAVIYLRGQFSESQSPQSPQGPQSPQSPQGTDGSEAPQVGVDKETEVKAFKRFMSKPRSRDFVFQYHTSDEAELLKAGLAPYTKLTKRSSNDSPHFDKLKEIANQHSTALHAALLAGISGIPEAIASAVKAGAENPGLEASVAAQATAANLSFDTAQASDVLHALYTQSGMLGQTLGADAVGANPIPSKSIADLLNSRGFTLKGIDQTTTKQISDAIANGMQQGLSTRAIADQISQTATGPMLFNQADRIAITESNRAYNQAFSDQMSAAGYTQFYWLPDADACEDCAALEGNHDLSDPVPPEHPNCRCTVVTPEAQ